MSKKYLTLLFSLFSAISLTPQAAQAQGTIEIKPVTGYSTFQEAIDQLVPAILFLGGLICFAYIIYGGYKYLAAGTNADNVTAARRTILNAVIGLIVLTLSYAIWELVLKLVGLDAMFK